MHISGGSQLLVIPTLRDLDTLLTSVGTYIHTCICMDARAYALESTHTNTHTL